MLYVFNDACSRRGAAAAAIAEARICYDAASACAAASESRTVQFVKLLTSFCAFKLSV